MDPFSEETVRLIFVFFVPGFISMKIYDMLVPSDRRDFSKSMLEAVSFSCINFAILYWPIVAIHSNDFQYLHQLWYYIISLVILFVFPIAWPFIFLRTLSLRLVRRKIIDPILKPWDRVFRQREDYWVVVHLKDGRMVGGRYGSKSTASSYPADEQIFIEEVWSIDQKSGTFLTRVDQTGGMLISKGDFEIIEFFK